MLVFFLFYLFIYFWLCWVFIPMSGLSLVVGTQGCSLIAWTSHCDRFSCCKAEALVGFSDCSTWAQYLWLKGPRACRLQSLWQAGLAALWHVRSSWTRDRTRIPCIGRWILNYLTTRKVPGTGIFKNLSKRYELAVGVGSHWVHVTLLAILVNAC